MNLLGGLEGESGNPLIRMYPNVYSFCSDIITRTQGYVGLYSLSNIYVSPNYRELKKTEFFLREALRSSNTCVFVWDIESGNITLDMPHLFGLLGENCSKLTLSQGEWINLIHPEDRELHKNRVREFLRQKNQNALFNSDYRVLTGEKYAWINTRGKFSQDVELTDGRLHIIGRHTDITYRKEMELAAYKSAREDGLTGLLNRNSFIAVVQRYINKQKLELQKDRDRVIYIDLDGFKAVNDSYGHAIGDSVLIETSKRIRGVLRDTDIIGRLGGDEFAILLPAIEEDSLEKIAKKIQKSLCLPYEISYHGQNQLIHMVGPSIGLATLHDHGNTADEVIRNADYAMYEAKRMKDSLQKIQIFDEAIGRKIENDRLLMCDLEHALVTDDNQIYPVFQPIIDRHGKVVSLEALIRWNHPNRGNIPPGIFIPLAEKNGLIGRVGIKMAKLVTNQIVYWGRDGKNNFDIAINLSPGQLLDTEFRDSFERLIIDTGIIPERITFEITETLLIQNLEIANSILEDLHKSGVTISLDDFGTGFSSLSRMSQLQSFIGQVKIDRSFITGIQNNPANRKLCETIIKLGHNFGFLVVAEGIETQAEFDTIYALGCDKFQGYFIQKPVEASDIPRELKRKVNIPVIPRIKYILFNR